MSGEKETYISQLKSEEPKVRMAGAKALGLMGEDAGEAAPYLAVLLDDIWIQHSVLWALRQMKGKLADCVVEISEKLKSPDDFARSAAAELIGECGRCALPYLDIVRDLAKNDPSGEIRNYAKESFFKIDPDATL
ncbi:MAG: hypothetical protein Fur0012_12230 [Elusimicrobiota bacterium]